MLCGVCGKERECPTTITLSEEMKETLQAQGLTPPDEYHYCAPCWRMVSDRERGARLLSGFFQVNLTGLGYANVDKAGAKLHAFLISKTNKRGLS
jgi:hypothetical protein